jgi:hypothetical protein
MALVRTDVWEERIASIISVKRITELEATLANEAIECYPASYSLWFFAVC